MPLTSDRDRSEELNNGREKDSSGLWKGIFWASVFTIVPTLICIILYVVLFKH